MAKTLKENRSRMAELGLEITTADKMGRDAAEVGLGVIMVLAALIGIWGLYRGRREPPPSDVDLPGPADYAATYAKFLGLTLINPLTVVYFAAFILGSGLAEDLTAAGAAFFVAGAFLASLSWQIGLAGIGAVARHRLPQKFRIGAVVAGNLLIIAMAAVIIAR